MKRYRSFSVFITTLLAIVQLYTFIAVLIMDHWGVAGLVPLQFYQVYTDSIPVAYLFAFSTIGFLYCLFFIQKIKHDYVSHIINYAVYLHFISFSMVFVMVSMSEVSSAISFFFTMCLYLMFSITLKNAQKVTDE